MAALLEGRCGPFARRGCRPALGTRSSDSRTPDGSDIRTRRARRDCWAVESVRQGALGLRAGRTVYDPQAMASRSTRGCPAVPLTRMMIVREVELDHVRVQTTNLLAEVAA